MINILNSFCFECLYTWWSLAFSKISNTIWFFMRLYHTNSSKLQLMQDPIWVWRHKLVIMLATARETIFSRHNKNVNNVNDNIFQTDLNKFICYNAKNVVTFLVFPFHPSITNIEMKIYLVIFLLENAHICNKLSCQQMDNRWMQKPFT